MVAAALCERGFPDLTMCLSLLNVKSAKLKPMFQRIRDATNSCFLTSVFSTVFHPLRVKLNCFALNKLHNDRLLGLVKNIQEQLM